MPRDRFLLKPNTYLPSRGETCFSSLDGSDVAAWLEAHGHRVVRFYNTGRCGLAITDEGIAVSTNGYIYRVVLA